MRRERVVSFTGRVRRGSPYLGSALLNLGLLFVLAAGYTSFVAKGVVGGGLGERVVEVQLYDRLPTDDPLAEIETPETEEPEELEEGEIGQDALPEGQNVEQGEEIGEAEGDEPPDVEQGVDVATAKRGVEVPQVALPEVDPGEGRPDGIVGVDCYAVFADNRDKALECAGRDILSGWRAEVDQIGEEWESFARDLGTGERRIRYGPLRGRPQELEGFGPSVVNAAAVPREVQERYAAEVERLRREQLIREYGRDNAIQEENRERKERDMDAATYEPVSPDLPD
jgi:hypothetical protein